MVSRISPSAVAYYVSILCLLTMPFSVQAAPPKSPDNFTFRWDNDGSIHATWEDDSNDETGFIVAYKTSPTAQYSGYGEVAANIEIYNDTPTDWPGCTTFYWAVFAFKGPEATREYSTVSNEVMVVAPPRLSSDGYASGMVGEAFTYTMTTSCASPVYSTGPLPTGLTFTAATGKITGTVAAPGRHTVNVSVTAGGKTGTQPVKFTFFRPVPALVPPVNGTVLPDRVYRKNGAPVQTDLSTHFSDPDVTTATRVVYNVGTMDFVYYPSAAPATVTNFLGYVSRGDYINTFIHRCPKAVVNPTKFVLQGGGYKADATATKVTAQPAVVNEPEITNARGTIAMAKLGNDPNSATCEYFISLADNAAILNPQNEGFTVFGRVAGNGMTVADSIWDLPIKNFSPLQGQALSECPVLAPAPATFTPDSLIKIISAGPVNPLAFTATSSAPATCGAAVNGTMLTVTPLAAGTADVTVVATDLDNQPLSRTFKVTVEERLSDWLTAQNFPLPADATAAANPDGDVAPNIMEYALMTNPQSTSPQPLPVAGAVTVESSRYLTLAFPVRKFTGGGFVYAVEANNGLNGTWTEVWNSTQGFNHAQVTSSTDGPDRTDVIVRDTAAFAAGGKRFLRLRVTDTP